MFLQTETCLFCDPEKLSCAMSQRFTWQSSKQFAWQTVQQSAWLFPLTRCSTVLLELPKKLEPTTNVLTISPFGSFLGKHLFMDVESFMLHLVLRYAWASIFLLRVLLYLRVSSTVLLRSFFTRTLPPCFLLYSPCLPQKAAKVHLVLCFIRTRIVERDRSDKV